MEPTNPQASRTPQTPEKRKKPEAPRAISRDPEDSTARLTLFTPERTDREELHRLYSDPRVWPHFPSGRFADIETTDLVLSAWMEDWERDGLGSWLAYHDDTLTGHGGCAVRRDTYWNLGYRFFPESQGRGFATELSLTAVERARATRPELPVVACILEHNSASAAVARKAGLTLRYLGLDRGNPDPTAVRLIFSDRALSPTELEAALD